MDPETDLDEQADQLLTLLEKRIDDRIDSRVPKAEHARPNFSGIGATDNRPEFDLQKMILLAMGEITTQEAIVEREMCDDTASKLQELSTSVYDGMRLKSGVASFKSTNTATGAAGGFLVPETIMDVVEDLVPQTIAGEMGMQTVRGKGTINFPRELTSPGVAWTDTEGVGTFPLNDATIGQVALQPHWVGSRVRLTRGALTQTQDAEGWIRRLLSRDLALGIDAAVFMGDGANSEPLGIFNATNLPAQTFTTADLGPAAQTMSRLALQTLNTLRNADVPLDHSSIGWAGEPDALALFEQVLNADNDHVYQDMDEAGMLRLHGKKFRTSTQLASGVTNVNLLVGDFSQVRLASFAPVALTVHEQDADVAAGSVQLRVIGNMDIAVMNIDAFVQCTVLARTLLP